MDVKNTSKVTIVGNRRDHFEKIDLKQLLILYLVSFFISVGLLSLLKYWSPWFAIFLFPGTVCFSILIAFFPFLGMAILLNPIRTQKRYTFPISLLLLLVATAINTLLLVMTINFFAQAGFWD
jgi:hypothetical protein